jgi:hypothetical protein
MQNLQFGEKGKIYFLCVRVVVVVGGEDMGRAGVGRPALN